MDREAVFERAEVVEHPEEFRPGESGDDVWIATDPETGCRGVGSFENEARTNLVYAVEVYREDRDRTVPYMSAGHGSTTEMGWLDDESITDRVRDLLPL
jgi:hypothetical protein